ncbi:MAG: thiamine phosphate synthase [Flavobacteriales bacterium]
MLKIAVISSTEISSTKEIELMKKLFDEGLNIFHVRRPNYNYKKMKDYLSRIPEEYHNRLVLHSHPKLALKFNLKGIHITSKVRKSKFKFWFVKRFVVAKKKELTVSTSLHHLTHLDNFDPLFNYVFLSPIFDSISKKDYQSGFNEFTLRKGLERTKYSVYALGGVELANIDKVKEYGFSGVALVGSIWTAKDPIQAFKEIKEKCR